MGKRVDSASFLIWTLPLDPERQQSVYALQNYEIVLL